MAISVEKSKALAVGCEDLNAAIRLNNQSLEEVEYFTYRYLGSNIDKSGKASTEGVTRIWNGGRAYQMWQKKVFRSTNYNLSKATNGESDEGF